MAEYMSERELRKIERERLKEREKKKLEKESKRKDKEEREALAQIERDLAIKELELQRGRLLEEREMRRRSEAIDELNKIKLERERMEETVLKVLQSKRLTVPYSTELEKLSEDELFQSMKDPVAPEQSEDVLANISNTEGRQENKQLAREDKSFASENESKQRSDNRQYSRIEAKDSRRKEKEMEKVKPDHKRELRDCSISSSENIEKSVSNRKSKHDVKQRRSKDEAYLKKDEKTHEPHNTDSDSNSSNDSDGKCSRDHRNGDYKYEIMKNSDRKGIRKSSHSLITSVDKNTHKEKMIKHKHRKNETTSTETSAESENISGDEINPINRKNVKASDMLGWPNDSSTDVDEKKNSNKEFEREMKWLDEKYEMYKRQNSELEESIRSNIEQMKTIERSSSDKEKHRSRNSQRKTSQKEETSETEISSDEEEKIKERISKLKLMEKQLNKEIEKNQRLKDIDKKAKQEREYLHELEKKNEREERLNRLRERERKVLDSVREKELTLSLIEDSRGDDKPVSTLEKRRNTKEINVENFKGKLYKPNIPSLTEDTFEEWKMEVDVILKSDLYPEPILRQAVRNSLCGQTRKILLTVNHDATTRELIDKLESVYGNVTSGESVLTEFYSSSQKKDEGVSEWGLRLEGILQRAIEKGHVKVGQKEEMLKTRFWRHLRREDLKSATRMYFEIAKSFEELRRKVRQEENEMDASKMIQEEEDNTVVGISQQSESNEQTLLMKTILGRMSALEKELTHVQESRNKERDERYDNKHKMWSRRDKRDRERDKYDRYDRRTYERDSRDRYKKDDDDKYRNRFESRNRDNDDGYHRRGSDKYERDRERYTDRYNKDRDRYRSNDRGDERNRDRRYDERYGYDRERRHNRDNRSRNRFHERSERNENKYRDNRRETYRDENRSNDTRQGKELPAEKRVTDTFKPDTTNTQQEQRNDNTSKTKDMRNLNR